MLASAFFLKSEQSSHKIFSLMHERNEILREVVTRVVDAYTRGADHTQRLQQALQQAAFHEMERIEAHPSSLDLKPYEFWQNLAKKLHRMGEHQSVQTLRDLVWLYAKDIVGHFNPNVYHFSTRILPMALGPAFHNHPFKQWRNPKQSLRERILVRGSIDHLRTLAKIGTLVFVPTHSSNLDSIVVGWALHDALLPPVTYGAGKNLFVHPIMSFFMKNLGAYKVDRRIAHSIYKDTLKMYSQVLIERHYHSLFFPGGGRSRSNQVEQHLKLGLLGTALSAYEQQLHLNRPQKIFICPVTINYHLVLEARTLIDEFLKKEGGPRFIIDDDEFSDWDKWLWFIREVMRLDYTIELNFAPPLDILGHPVDPMGMSMGPLGQSLELKDYFSFRGKLVQDPDRNAAYTRECGQAIQSAYQRHTVILSTHFLSHVVHQFLKEKFKDFDLYQRFPLSKGEWIPLYLLKPKAQQLLDLLKEKSSEISLSNTLLHQSLDHIIQRGAQILSRYHIPNVLMLKDGGIEVHDPKLLFYYANRLAHLSL